MRKKYFRILAVLFLLCCALSACKKEPSGPKPGDSVSLDNIDELVEYGCPEHFFYLCPNWYYATESGERDEEIEGVFVTLYAKFSSIFREEAMSYKPIVIYNDPEAENPRTSPLTQYNVIRLSLDETGLWNQQIFQLSHEMTHYAYFSLTPGVSLAKGDWNDMNSGWNEEIICEAMSFYILDYMAENWDECPLSAVNSDYASLISQYREKNITEGQPLISTYGSCDGAAFKFLSDYAGAEARDMHAGESAYCYELFGRYDDDEIGEVLNMYKYYDDEFSSINYADWEASTDYPEFVKELSAIQPEIA